MNITSCLSIYFLRCFYKVFAAFTYLSMFTFHYKKSVRIHGCPVIIISFISLLHFTLSEAQFYYYDYEYTPYLFQQDFYNYRQTHPLNVLSYPQIVPFYIPSDTDSSSSESDESGETAVKPGTQGSNQNKSMLYTSSQSQSSQQGSNLTPRLELEGRTSSYMKYLILDRECKAYGGVGDARSGVTNLNLSTTPKPQINGKGFLSDCWVELGRAAGLEKLVWQIGRPVKIIIHGYTPKTWNEADDIIEGQGLFRMGEEFKKDTNVIIVDWTVYAGSSYYPTAAANTYEAGLKVADFLVQIQQRNNYEYKDYWAKMHFIGFSLGAHVSGVAGQVLQRNFNVRVERITGLDPAGPSFDGAGGTWPEDRFYSLDNQDAGFVDVIHCNMGTPLSWLSAAIIGKYGTALRRGDVDFYPNGGIRQSPFCSITDDLRGCSHNTCLRYFTKSIRQKNYLACRCSSWELYVNGECRCEKNTERGTFMGDRVQKRVRGKFYLKITP